MVRGASEIDREGIDPVGVEDGGQPVAGQRDVVLPPCVTKGEGVHDERIWFARWRHAATQDLHLILEDDWATGDDRLIVRGVRLAAGEGSKHQHWKYPFHLL